MFAKDTWLKESNLESIRKTLQSITAYEKEIAEIQRRIEAINASVAQEKAAHPEYASYLVLSKTLKAKKNEYGIICSRVETAENTISVLSQRIQVAQDEVKKHSKYAELQAQEAKYMSASFLKSEIGKASAQITHLHNSINDLTRQQTAAQQTISDYEKKSCS